MDFNENSESSDDFLKNMTVEKNNASVADLISSASEKTSTIDVNGFGDSNDQISDCNSEGSFHSVETDENDVTDSNIDTVEENSSESADDNLNENAKAGSSNLICDEETVENLLNANSELLFTSGVPESQENPDLKLEKRNISTRIMSTEDEDTVTDAVLEHSKESPNTRHHAEENSVSHESEKSPSNDDVVENESFDDSRTAYDSQTSIIDEADESFSLDEIVEESECSDKDQPRVNSTNDENLAFDEDSMASIRITNSESLSLDNDEESTSSGKHQSCESPSNNEQVDSHEVNDNSICQDTVSDSMTVEQDDSSEENVDNSEDAGKESQNGKSPSKRIFSEVTAEAVATDITIRTSPSKSHLPKNSPTKHHMRSSVVSRKGVNQNSPIEDPTNESSATVPNDNVPSSHGESVSSRESTDTLLSVPDIPNEKESFQENNETEPSTNHAESSFMESASDSTQDLLRRVSLRRRKSSEGSEPSLSDTRVHGESDSSMLTAETHSRTNNHSTPSKSASNSPRSRSSWQPKINEVMSASGDLSVCSEEFNENATTDLEIKEEVPDDSYEMGYSAKERFNLVDFSIKLEKMDVDSDIEIISPPKTRLAARKSIDTNTSSKSRTRSGTLRNRMRSRTTTSRSRPTDRKASRSASTNGAARSDGKGANSAARRPADNRRFNAKASSTVSTRRNIRNLRSAGKNADEEDPDRIKFLRIFNLRSRKDSDDQNVKGILVKPSVNRVRSKRVSFQLPTEDDALNSSSGGRSAFKGFKEEDSTSKSAVKVSSSRSSKEDSASKSAGKGPSSKAAQGLELRVQLSPLKCFNKDSASKSVVKVPSRSATRSQTNKKAPVPAKRRRSSNVPEERTSESEDEVIDENPLVKFEQLVDVSRKTVDSWHECQCCGQKYYLLENVKRHVRTHFPNCLTN